MKPRVPLYGCSPCEVGTPLVESLTGFVGRLAVARQLPASAIFEHLVRPRVPEGVVRESLHLTSFLASEAVTYDGLGLSAQALVAALTELTGLPDLSHMTLLPWRGFLSPHNGALRWRRPKRWCCRCLADWRRNGRELWEPLLWRIAAVRRCPVHRIPFSDLCPRCRARQGVVPEIVPFGYCRKCGHSLEPDDPLLTDRSAGSLHDLPALWEWWTAHAVGRMLSSQRLLERSGGSRGFSDLLYRSLSRFGDRTVQSLAQHLGVGWNSIEVWMNGKRRPRLDSFLAVCMRLVADPLQVAVAPSPVPVPPHSLPWADARPPWPPIRSGTSPRRQRPPRRGPDYYRQLGLAVRSLLNQSSLGSLSVTAAACSLHTTRRTLMTRFPVEYARLVARHQAYCAETRDDAFALRREDLLEAVSECVSEGRYPSKRRVFAAAGLSRTFQRVPRYVEVWRDALREHGVQPYGPSV